MAYRIGIEATRMDVAAQVKAQRLRDLAETGAKTAKLRALRLAREAAFCEARGRSAGQGMQA